MNIIFLCKITKGIIITKEVNKRGKDCKLQPAKSVMDNRLHFCRMALAMIEPVAMGTNVP